MDNKKEVERAELHRAIWQIANDLRGSVDGWDFKQYVLGTLFYRYISEKLTDYLNAERALSERPRTGGDQREPQRDTRAGLSSHRELGDGHALSGRPHGTL